jgi:hypothetical protein
MIFNGFLVPRTGFEPAHPCERCDLNTVRLPISPPGHPTINTWCFTSLLFSRLAANPAFQECKYNFICPTTQLIIQINLLPLNKSTRCPMPNAQCPMTTDQVTLPSPPSNCTPSNHSHPASPKLRSSHPHTPFPHHP